MRILIVNLGTIEENIASSVILNYFLKEKNNFDITWVLKNNPDKYIFSYRKNINVISIDELNGGEYDILININPLFSDKLTMVNAKEKIGFGFDDQKYYEELLLGEKEDLNINVFQIYYKILGIIWKGEGYSIGYFPRTRSKKNRVGISVAHANLRNYLHDNLDLKSAKMWNIPYKKNIFKKMDELNKCSRIITDNLLTFHLSVYLRKYVYFLETIPLNTKLEFFGNGEIYEVPTKIIQ